MDNHPRINETILSMLTDIHGQLGGLQSDVKAMLASQAVQDARIEGLQGDIKTAHGRITRVSNAQSRHIGYLAGMAAVFSALGVYLKEHLSYIFS